MNTKKPTLSEMPSSILGKTITLKTGLRMIGAVSPARVLPTSAQWDGSTAVNNCEEKMILLVFRCVQ